jgi:hypothetical protein
VTQINLFGQQQDTLTSDDYYTPKWIFDTLGLHFDLDVASPPHETNVPCDRYLTKADDGLATDWYGRVWCNPPYSRALEWITRWLDHGNGCLMVVASRSKAYQELNNSQAKFVLPDQRALKFNKPGQRPQNIPYLVTLWAIGDDNIAALHNMGKVR